ncbi:MAG: 2,3-bisphosphoglycerate-independent phosphoglycerate mutase [Cellulosilyticum sp.]|nr:2,3-bisphosphoglycerate-independent phosphoglycerate mutase [Cellulosilyticum sp.]
MENRKCIFLIADGLGDRPVKEMNHKTPLEYAKTPTLDQLVANGMAGLVHPYRAGTRCGTDWGHLCLFGYDPEKFYTGRGSIEAYSAGLELQEGDVAFRGNLATIDENLCVVDRRAGRISDTEEINQLIAEVNGMEMDGYQLLLKPLTEHRVAVVVRGKGLGGKLPDTDPGTACEGEKVVNPAAINSWKGTDEDRRTAEMLWKFLMEINRIWSESPVNKKRIENGQLPANFILTRGSGKAMVPPAFTEQYPNAKVAVIAGDETITGIGRMCGFDGYSKESFTGGFETDYMGKAKMAMELLPNYDLVIVHVKGTDLCGHDNLPFKKAEIIEQIDGMFRYWMEQEGSENWYFAMTADHSTPCCRRDHSADPVPSFMAGPDVRKDAVEAYGERACAEGIIDQYTGAQLMATIMDYLWFSKKYGA